jgi:hypothetical protein
MKTNLKPADSKARVLLKKLLALAERGIDGEKTSAQRKIRRLRSRGLCEGTLRWNDE